MFSFLSLYNSTKNTTMETANHNQDSKLKMGKEKKKGKLRRALKKVFCCLFPRDSFKSKEFPDDDVYELSTSKTQTVPTTSSREIGKVSAIERIFACQAKKSEETVQAQLSPIVLLGGAVMISGSECSDDSGEVYLPATQRKTIILKIKRKLQLFLDFSAAF